MLTFEIDAVPWRTRVEGSLWTVSVKGIYNPSVDEINSNKAHNLTVGNWDPEHERSTCPQVDLVVRSDDGDVFEMYWLPIEKILGPHISRRGWSRGTLNAIKQELIRWKLA